jgi:penicillin-binding protein 2
VTGVLPSIAWKKHYFRKQKPEQQKWYAGETISLGIGQGYNNFTMLQMATAVSTLSSGGQRFKPRLVREIEDVVDHKKRRVASDALEPLPLKPDNVSIITNAMYGVTQEGTSRAVFVGAPYKSGGKTGTAQAVSLKAGEKYSSIKMDEHKRDHSLYIAFAPLEAPTIALAVIVENAGFGSTSAAPIARRVFDYVLLGNYPGVDDIALVQKGQATVPIGQPRPVASVPLAMPGAASAVAPGASAAAPAASAPASASTPSPGSRPASAPPRAASKPGGASAAAASGAQR